MVRLCLVLVLQLEEPGDGVEGAVAMKWVKARWVPYVGTLVGATHEHKVVGLYWPIDADYITVELEDFVIDNLPHYVKQFVDDGWEVEIGL